MDIKLLNLKKQYSFLKEAISESVNNVLLSGNYINGSQVREFENRLSDFLNVKHVISVANGTDAIVIALRALDIGRGDEVITTPFTFFATAEAISVVGATPVFVDVNLTDFNISPREIEKKITAKTKAILPVHIFGSPAEMDAIMSIARKHNLYVLEDTAQAIGAKYKDSMVGTIGDIGTFSFFPTKNLGTYGDGGAIVTNDNKLAKIARALKSHGSGEAGEQAYACKNDDANMINKVESSLQDDTVYNFKKYYNYFIGYNSRLDELHAAILNIKLNYLDEWNSQREVNAKFYHQHLNDSKFKLMELQSFNKNVYHMYILQSESREDDIKKLTSKGISTGVYYPIPLHLQKVYENLGYQAGDLPNAEYLSKRTFAIPVDPELTLKEKEYIVKILNRI